MLTVHHVVVPKDNGVVDSDDAALQIDHDQRRAHTSLRADLDQQPGHGCVGLALGVVDEGRELSAAAPNRSRRKSTGTRQGLPRRSLAPARGQLFPSPRGNL